MKRNIKEIEIARLQKTIKTTRLYENNLSFYQCVFISMKRPRK